MTAMKAYHGQYLRSSQIWGMYGEFILLKMEILGIPGHWWMLGKWIFILKLSSWTVKNKQLLTIYKAQNHLFFKQFSLRKRLSSQGIAVSHECHNIYPESLKRPDVSNCGVFMIEASTYCLLEITIKHWLGRVRWTF